MNNYVYIVAGLPELVVSYDGSNFDYAEVKAQILELLSDSDQQLVALLEEGFDENTLGAGFYEKAAKSKNEFVRAFPEHLVVKCVSVHFNVAAYHIIHGYDAAHRHLETYGPVSALLQQSFSLFCVECQ